MRNGGRFRRTRCLSRRIVIRYGVPWLTSESNSRRSFMRNHWAMTTLLFAGIFICCLPLCAQEKVVWSDQEKLIVEQILGLRKLDDSVRARTTKCLALQIRQLPAASRGTQGERGLRGRKDSQEFCLRPRRKAGGAVDSTCARAASFSRCWRPLG